MKPAIYGVFDFVGLINNAGTLMCRSPMCQGSQIVPSMATQDNSSSVAIWLIAMTLSPYSAPQYSSRRVCIMMEYHLKERKREGGCGLSFQRWVCGLLVKVLLVGAVYDTFLVGCTTAIHSD